MLVWGEGSGALLRVLVWDGGSGTLLRVSQLQSNDEKSPESLYPLDDSLEPLYL